MDEPTNKALDFIKSVSIAVEKVKPEATTHEVIGVIYQILSRTITTLQNEQTTGISPETGGRGTSAGPGQVRTTGYVRREGQSEERLRSEQGSSTKSGRKKRRSKKASS